MKYYLLFLVLITGLNGCRNNNITPTPCCAPPPQESATHYINDYYVMVDQLRINSVAQLSTLDLVGNADEYHGSKVRLSVSLLGTQKIHNGSSKFKRMALHYGDTGYAKFGQYDHFGVSIADTIRSIDIFTLKDYNQNYKANSRLNKMVKVTYKSAKEMLESNYKSNSGENKLDSLTIFNQRANYLIGKYLAFLFYEDPDSTDFYSFKIRYKESNGKVLEHEFFCHLKGQKKK